MAEGFSGFEHKAIRRNFTRRVHGLLLVQLVTTGAISALFVLVPAINHHVRTNLRPSCSVFIIALTVLASCQCCRRALPDSLPCLATFTAVAGAGAGLVAALPAPDSVLVTVAATAAASLAITLLGLRTRAGNQPQRSLKLYNH